MNENNHSRVKTKTKRLQKPVKTSNDFSYILPLVLYKAWIDGFLPEQKSFSESEVFVGFDSLQKLLPTYYYVELIG